LGKRDKTDAHKCDRGEISEMNNKLILFLLFLSILSLGLVSGLSDDAGTTIDFSYPDSTNYSTINVNDSIYWDGNAWSDTRWLDIDGSNANQNIDIGAWNVSATHFIGDGSFLTGISSYWDRVGTVLSPSTAGDDITTTGTGSSFGGLTDSSIADTYIPYSNSNRLTASKAKYINTAGEEYIDLSEFGGASGYDEMLIIGTDTIQGFKSGFAKNKGDLFFNMISGSGNTIFGGGVTGDTFRRFRLSTEGSFQWGDGTFTADGSGDSPRLSYRSAGRLTISGDIVIFGRKAGENSLQVRGPASHTANLLLLENSAGGDLFKVDASGDVSILVDDKKLSWGAAGDGSILYDGTDMIINPKEVGTGSLKVLGDITTTGTGTFGDATIGNGYTGNCINTIFVSGIATGCND